MSALGARLRNRSVFIQIYPRSAPGLSPMKLQDLVQRNRRVGCSNYSASTGETNFRVRKKDEIRIMTLSSR